MKNPLRKRILRDIRKEKGKYLSIFAFITIMVAAVSGMLVAAPSMMKTYDDGIEEYLMEDGHFELDQYVSPVDIMSVNQELDEKLTVCELPFFNFTYKFKDDDYDIRVYAVREEMNLPSLIKGELPKSNDDVAIDRLFAENNNIKVGDTLKFNDKTYTVCGFVALPDYSCLYKNNSDLMFNASSFSFGLVTKEEFERIDKSKIHYGYAYRFDDRSLDDTEMFDASDDAMKEIAKSYILKDFVKKQVNKGINFAREDMGRDSTMMIAFLYIMIVLLGFIFALLINSTIEKEAKEIGCLRASGYTKREIVSHYMIAPMIVSFAGAALGNVLGYTVFEKMIMKLYYHSYSLPNYKVVWSSQAFIMTTVVPLVMLILICYISLRVKISLSPLKFLRGDLSKKSNKKAVKLPNFKFFTRFRLRVLIQNTPNYITMIIGILFANVLFMFGATMLPIIEHHTDSVVESSFSEYQYGLKMPYVTSDENAESFCMTELIGTDERENELAIYGINQDSKYVTAKKMPVNKNEVVVSTGVLNIMKLEIGDTLKVKEEYGDKEYEFVIVDSFKYPASLAVFMDIDNFNEIFDMPEGYFSGYFSNEKLADIPEEYIYNTITRDDLTNLSTQLNDSMGAMMPVMKYASVVIFLIVIYLLAKIVLEKNQLSIALSKILGYNNGEIGRIYIVSTAIAVVIALLISIPVSYFAIKVIFQVVMVEFGVWAEVVIDPIYFGEMIAFAIAAFGIIGLSQMRRINKIPMEKALKGNE